MGPYLAMSLRTLLSYRLLPVRHFSFRKINFQKAAILSAVHVVGILIIITFFAPAAFAGSDTVEWDFTGSSLSGWRVKRAGSVTFSNEGLVLVEDVTGPKLVSPVIAGGLGLVASGKFLVLRLASERDGYAILRIKGRSSLKMESFRLRGGGMEDYAFNLGPLFPPDGRVEALSLDLLTGGGSVTLQRISIFEPGGLERLFMLVSDFWRPETTTTKMINYIEGPAVSGLSFLVAGYILTAILFITAFIIFVTRKKPLSVMSWGSPPFRAFVAAFVVAAALFAVRMEYRWAALYGQDSGLLKDDASGTRIFTLFSQGLPEFLRFLDYVKATVPEGETVRAATNSSGEYLRLARYRLLPVRSSEGAGYIWSYNDRGLFFDEAGMRLMDGARVIAAPVERVGRFGARGALYRVSGAKLPAPGSSALPGGATSVAGAGGAEASNVNGTIEGGA